VGAGIGDGGEGRRDNELKEEGRKGEGGGGGGRGGGGRGVERGGGGGGRRERGGKEYCKGLPFLRANWENWFMTLLGKTLINIGRGILGLGLTNRPQHPTTACFYTSGVLVAIGI